MQRRPQQPTKPPGDPKTIQARVLYCDDWVIVLNKPAGLAVHPGPSGAPSLEPWLDHLRFGFKDRPELAHRLDRDTSGCLVLGRNRRALRRLGALFRDGLVQKRYWAIAQGKPEASEGRINLPLLKVSDRSGWRIVVDPGGQPAITLWQRRGQHKDRCWLELQPKTGRTHQLRVHLAAMGWPIVGDRFYGGTGAEAGGLCLHARGISFRLRDDLPTVSIQAPLPAHFEAALCDFDTAMER